MRKVITWFVDTSAANSFAAAVAVLLGGIIGFLFGFLLYVKTGHNPAGFAGIFVGVLIGSGGGLMFSWSVFDYFSERIRHWEQTASWTTYLERVRRHNAELDAIEAEMSA